MGIYKGKRKRGLTLTVRKKTTYSKCRSRPCYSNSASPFPKRCKTSPTVRTSTAYKKVSPSKDADNNEFNTSISTDTFPTSENQSRGQLSSVSDEIIKLIPSVLNELAKVGKENVLQKFFSQVSCSRFPLNNTAFQLWCDVVDWFDKTSVEHFLFPPLPVRLKLIE